MLNKELIKKLAQKIDDKVDWVKITGKAPLGRGLEIVDNYALPWGLDYLNANYGDKIPEQYQDEVERAIECFINDDYQGMVDVIPEALDEIIDIKCFDDDFEALFIGTNINAMFKSAKYYAQKQIDKE